MDGGPEIVTPHSGVLTRHGHLASTDSGPADMLGYKKSKYDDIPSFLETCTPRPTKEQAPPGAGILALHHLRIRKKKAVILFRFGEMAHAFGKTVVQPLM